MAIVVASTDRSLEVGQVLDRFLVSGKKSLGGFSYLR
jgi:hypothetical protein